MTPSFFLRPNTGRWAVPMPDITQAPARANATSGMSFSPARGETPAQVMIDTDDPELLRLAWRNAAEAVMRLPPACPQSDPLHDFELLEGDGKLIPRLWRDWLRIVTNFAIRCPNEMEEWATDFAAENTSALASAVTNVFEQWQRDYSVDLWSVKHRVTGGSLTRGPERLSEAERANPTFSFDELVPQSADGLRALGRVFAWRKETARDTRPGLLESRWIHWPTAVEPLVSVFLAHPAADPTKASFPAPEPMEVPA